MAITPLPPAPQPGDTPQEFNTKAFLFVDALDTFVTEANAQAVTVNSDASSASASAGTATTKAAEAAASAAAASATANVTQWSSGATYAAGANVWSPITYLTYRNKTGTNTSTDPSADATNWEIVSGNVVDTLAQTLTNKTITGLIETNSALGTGSGTQTFNLNNGNYFTLTVNGTTTLAVSNTPGSGSVGAFVVQLTNGGSQTINYFSGITWAAGTAPVLTASGTDVLAFFTTDGGTTWRGLVLALDIKAP